MTGECSDFEVDLRAIGATVVQEPVLPAGPGVFPPEVGRPGPWYGVRHANGAVEGWARDVVQLGGLVQPNAIAYRNRIRALEREVEALRARVGDRDEEARSER